MPVTRYALWCSGRGFVHRQDQEGVRFSAREAAWSSLIRSDMETLKFQLETREPELKLEIQEV